MSYAAFPIDTNHAYNKLPNKSSLTWENAPPMDAMEYLLRVRSEAEKIPDVVGSTINPRDYDTNQTANMPSFEEFHSDQSVHHPSEEWIDDALSAFASLRQELLRAETIIERSSLERLPVPASADEQGWEQFLYGSEHKPGHAPSSRIIIQMNQVLTRTLLSYQASRLSSVSLTEQRALWVYALLARLDKPLTADAAALVRQLLRECCRQRESISFNSEDHKKAVNLIIYISSRFFGQEASNYNMVGKDQDEEEQSETISSADETAEVE